MSRQSDNGDSTTRLHVKHHDEMPWYTQHSHNRVVQFLGVDAATFTSQLDPLPADAPAIVQLPIDEAQPQNRLVKSILDLLESAARQLFPVWLPGAEDFDGPNRLDVLAARSLANDLSESAGHFGPYVAALAESALRDHVITRTFIAETRAEGVRRLLASAYERDAVALILDVDPRVLEAAPNQFVGACEWLAHHGGFAVWVVGAPNPVSDRVRGVAVPLDKVRLHTRTDAEDTGPVRIPALAGRPHPGSAAEKKLERALALCVWATGREWNQPFQPSSLHERIVVDLRWPAEKCVVEVDGPEHRHAAKFARDHQRDVVLQLHGYSVLRFTNEQVLDDVIAVVSAIESFIEKRRRAMLPRSAHIEGKPSGQ